MRQRRPKALGRGCLVRHLEQGLTTQLRLALSSAARNSEETATGRSSFDHARRRPLAFEGSRRPAAAPRLLPHTDAKSAPPTAASGLPRGRAST